MRRILLGLCLFISINIMGQKKNATGIYYNESGEKIEIKNDRFYFIIPQIHSPVYYNDTLAKCSFEWIDDKFICLNSDPVYPLKGLSINQFSDNSQADSIKVTFDIPIQRNLEINVYYNTHKSYFRNKHVDFIYSKHNKHCMLPAGIHSIGITISPKSGISHTPLGQYYGLVSVFVDELVIEEGKNHVTIQIPSLDDSFFEQYYISGDFAMVIGNMIVWKGEKYFKKKKRK